MWGMPSHSCAVHACVNWLIDAGFEASSWTWISGAVLCSWTLFMWREWEWMLPHSVWPLTLDTSLPLAWQRPSILVQSGGMAGTIWLEEKLSVCERLMNVWRWICSTHAGSELCGCGGGNVNDVIVCLLVLFKLCCTIGIVCGLPMVSQNFLENGRPGWWCCGWVLAHPFRILISSQSFPFCMPGEHAINIHSILVLKPRHLSTSVFRLRQAPDGIPWDILSLE